MKTNEEIVKDVKVFLTQTDSYSVELPYQVLYKIMDMTRLDTLTTMENLALWKGGNSEEEKILHFFKVLRDAKAMLNNV